ncbi:hypothetical protein POG22_05950, partial [Geitlerinema sp. CS-897]|nr:hypothetical protein [Geitlerinema sp. CS-897]
FPIETLKNLAFSSAMADLMGKLESKTTIGQAVRHQNSLCSSFSASPIYDLQYILATYVLN